MKKRIAKTNILILLLSFNSLSSIINDRYYYNDKNFYKSCWQWLDLDNDGIYECYYFNALGHMYKNGITLPI